MRWSIFENLIESSVDNEMQKNIVNSEFGVEWLVFIFSFQLWQMILQNKFIYTQVCLFPPIFT